MNKVKLKIVAGGLLVSMLTYTSPIFAYTKDETVYSKMNAKGEEYKTTVSTHLENNKNEKILEDLTNLLDIQNTNGDETYEKDGNKLIWQADGKDIYYQGNTKANLPITCEVKYTLDGKEISPEDLAGKSGKVTIEIIYTNHEKHEVQVNGGTHTLYTPFLVLSGTIINNDNNRNVMISNGKVINDGSKTIVVGMATPAMKESLGLSNKNINLQDNIKISMETTDFELSNIITVATPKVLEKEEYSILDELDDIYSKVNTLQASSNEIEKGAGTLKDGITTYYEKSKEFNQAMNKVEKGTSSANSQYDKLNQGISTLNSSSSVLNSGAKQVSDGTKAVKENLSKINTGLKDAQSGSKALNAGIKQVQTGINEIQKNVSVMSNANATNNTQISQVQGLVSQNTVAINALIAGLPSNIQAKIANGSLTNADIATLTKEQQLNVQSIKLLQANNNALTQSISQSSQQLGILSDKLLEVKKGVDKISEASEKLQTGITSLQKGTDTLETESYKLVEGSKQLQTGTKALQTGTEELHTGSLQMKAGLSSLKNGTSRLLDANNSLTDGAKTLQTGAKTLHEGINRFNREGITPICNYINGDLKNLSSRAEKLIELSEEYQTFTKLKNGEEGNVKFIMMTDSIKKDDKQNKQAITNIPSIEGKKEEK